MSKLIDVIHIFKPCECRNCGETIIIFENNKDFIHVTDSGEPISTDSIDIENVGYCKKCKKVYKNIGFKGMHYFIQTNEDLNNPNTNNPFIK